MIRRNILNGLLDHLKEPEITLITGPRQVGKTTLMHELAKKLREDGHPSLFLHLDNEADSLVLASQASLIQRIRSVSAIGKVFVFIDEIQLKENAGFFMKGLYDMQLPVKFILSGSGSMELRASIQESMAGRKRVFEVMPVNFFEFADYRTHYLHTDRLNSYLMEDFQTSLALLNEYLNFGGYPRVIMASTIHEKMDVINEIYQSYMTKDIQNLLKGHGPEVYGRMICLLAAQTGGMVNLSTLSNETRAAQPTIQKYLWYAGRTWFLKMIPPLHGNRIKEITKSPVVYFVDHGMRNFSIRMFGNVHNHRDYGFVFQNLVCTLLLDTLQRHIYDLHFWRTINKAEVDFVIDRYENPLPVEVKYASLQKPEVTRSLRSFIDHYHPTDAWVINLSYSGKLLLDKTAVHFIPFFRIQHYLDDLRTEPERLFRISEKEVVYRLMQPPGTGRMKKKGLYSKGAPD
ncbi:MAG: ATP-binding protein [Bacteroidetes bacterium]|nr:ATP-binding protein [Bacteroidota bacterium]